MKPQVQCPRNRGKTYEASNVFWRKERLKDRKSEREKEEKRKLREERKADRGEAMTNVAGAFPKRFKSMASKEASSLRIAIDLSFDDLMSDRDMMKLLKQVQRTYSVIAGQNILFNCISQALGTKRKESYTKSSAIMSNGTFISSLRRIAKYFPKKT